MREAHRRLACTLSLSPSCAMRCLAALAVAVCCALGLWALASPGAAYAQERDPAVGARAADAPGLPEGSGESAADTTGLPVPLSGFSDEGDFGLYVNEERIVTTTFNWEEDGSYWGKYVLSVAGQEATTEMTIDVDDGGLWTEITMKTPAGPVSVVRKGSIGYIIHKGDTTTVQLKPRTVLFENFNPALMSLAVLSYDQDKGGVQTISIFIVPGVVMDGSIERLEPVERAVAGRDVILTPYVYGLPGVNVTVYVDADNRVVYGDVPQQHAAYVRAGYETMRAAQQDSLVSRPEHEVQIDRNVKVPMRDGLKLATDIYRPKAEGKFPVVLVRTPYKKEMIELQAKFFARRGYVYAVQDCRGRFSSPGVWEPFVNEARDGYDTVEWLALQPWATGKVGMIGASYLGWVQWWAARDRPPHLAAIIPNVSPPDPYFNIPYENGTFFIFGSIWWAKVLESEATADITGKAFSDVMDMKYASILRHLPVIDLDEKVLGKKNPYWRKWIEHPDNDEYWEPANFLDHLKDLDIPVFHQSGWFDGDGIGSKLNYLKMASYGHKYQKLVLGPWGHTDQATRRIGDQDFGEAAIIDLQVDYLRWLDHWLKGVDNGIDREPLVSLFVMGSNRWVHGDTYPLVETLMTKIYLTSAGHANSSGGDGALVTEPAAAGTPADRYAYDPGDPTPSPDFYVAPEDLTEDEERPSKKSMEEELDKYRAYWAKVDEERDDILVYDTAPLEEPLTFAGPVSAVLYAASSAKDTDWFMRLSRVDENGRIYGLVEGKIRARYRESYSDPKLLEPGRVYEYHLDLWQTGITIPVGNKLRVEVASASFPMFSRNLNTGGHNETETEFVEAEQTIYHDDRYPSHVLLPVLPDFK
jgi:putative CocE/NonD family hydrolase